MQRTSQPKKCAHEKGESRSGSGGNNVQQHAVSGSACVQGDAETREADTCSGGSESSMEIDLEKKRMCSQPVIHVHVQNINNLKGRIMTNTRFEPMTSSKHQVLYPLHHLILVHLPKITPITYQSGCCPFPPLRSQIPPFSQAQFLGWDAPHIRKNPPGTFRFQFDYLMLLLFVLCATIIMKIKFIYYSSECEKLTAVTRSEGEIHTVGNLPFSAWEAYVIRIDRSLDFRRSHAEK